MTTCVDCATAALQQHHAFQAGCMGCAARAVSRSQQFFQSRRDGRQGRDYIAMLEALGLTHNQVKAAHAADAINRPEVLL